MKIKRRQFLSNAAVGTAGAVVGGQIPQNTAVAIEPVSLDPVAIVPLGKHLKTTRLGMGFGVSSSNRESNLTRRGMEHAEMVVRHAYDAGIRFFDNADLYGSHQLVARALKDKPRDSYVLSSKVWYHPNGVPQEDLGDADVMVKRFLEELDTDYLDLVQIHCQTRRDWPDEMRRQMDLLSGLKAEGLIRAHGFSSHAIPALEAAAEEPWVDVVHVRINPFGTKMSGPAEDVVPAIEKLHAAGKGIIGMKIIGEGQFSKDEEKRDQSIRFVTGLDCVDVMIVGFETPSDIDDLKTRVAAALAAG